MEVGLRGRAEANRRPPDEELCSEICLRSKLIARLKPRNFGAELLIRGLVVDDVHIELFIRLSSSAELSRSICSPSCRYTPNKYFQGITKGNTITHTRKVIAIPRG